ncbi:MAG: chemotaxis protein CheX [Agathobacter sp.]|nr:chemotaxis protein CheX [Agathobacter sp.]
MYTQFFGNFLIANGYITQEQLLAAMQKEPKKHTKLGTLAMHAGYMTASEVDEIIIQQTHEDRKFGEVAIEIGYLTNEQVITLLKSQSPDFLLLGQVLLDDGILTNQEFEKILTDYRSQNELSDLDMLVEDQDAITKLFENFLIVSEKALPLKSRMYIELLFNNFVRFIGDEFSPLYVEEVREFPLECCVKQEVSGNYSIVSYLCMNEETAVAFASSYVEEQFFEYDVYVKASLEDFLNLHNGLFIVNVSNGSSTELVIGPPEQVEEPLLTFEHKTYHIPVLYTFGTVHFLMEVIKTDE